MPMIPRSTDLHHMHGATFTPLASPRRGSQETSVWRVELAADAPATPHQVTREEIFVIEAGRVSVELGGERFEAGVGDVVVVPPATDFALAAIGGGLARALVCLPVGGQARLVDGTTFTPPWAE
ncbi:MAG: cupin domain-containing protein [Myxococcales bacterium]|nr:cupin domain-containing protein [Myxococcales bacterium]